MCVNILYQDEFVFADTFVQEDTHIGEHNIWLVVAMHWQCSRLTRFHRFFDDIELLKERWQSSNTENVGEL